MKKPLILSISKYTKGYTSEKGNIISAQNLQKTVFSKFAARRSAGKTDRKFINDNYLIAQFIIVLMMVIFQFISMGLNIFIEGEIYNHFSRKILSEYAIASDSNFQERLQNIVDEGINYASALAILFQSYDFTSFTRERAPEIINVFHESSKTFSNSILWYQVSILTTDSIIGYRPHLPNQLHSTYVADNSTDHWIYSWLLDDEGKNPYFPTSNGRNLSTRTKTREIPEVKESLKYPNSVTFGAPQFGFKSHTKQTFILISKAILSDGEPVAVVHVALDLEAIQKLTKELSFSENSRVAVSSHSGILIGLTGSDELVDTFQGSLITKTLFQLRDPVWSIIVNDTQFQSGENYSKPYVINNVVRDYIVTISPTPIEGSNTELTIYSLVCYSDIAPISKGSQQLDIIIYIIVSLVFGAIVFASYNLAVDLISMQSNSPFSNDYNDSTSHIKKFTLETAVDDLKCLRQREDNPAIVAEINSMIDQLEHTGEKSLIRVSDFDQIVNDPKLNDLFIKVFQRPNVNAKVEIVNNSYSNFLQESKDKKDVEIIEHALRYAGEYFSEEGMTKYIQSLLSKIDETEIPYMMHSFRSIMAINDMRVSYPKDLLFGMLIANAIFHILMKNRKQKTESIDCLFFKSISYTLRTLYCELKELHSILLPEYKENWSTIAFTSYALTNMIPLNRHLSACSRTVLYRGILRDQKMATGAVSFDILNVIFICSMCPYLFRRKRISHEIIDGLIGKDEHTKKCLVNEYYPAVKSALIDICGAPFVKKLADYI